MKRTTRKVFDIFFLVLKFESNYSKLKHDHYYHSCTVHNDAVLICGPWASGYRQTCVRFRISG